MWNLIEAEAKKREARGDKVIALHVGDTYIPFPKALTEPIPGEDKMFGKMLNRYSDTFGEAPLRRLILDKVRKRNQIPAEGIDCIQITGGATGALHAAFNQLLEPGSEVMTLAPYWSILRNVAATAKVKLVEVPFFDLLAKGIDKPDQAHGFNVEEHLKQHKTPKTAALYLNTPSNPTGMLLDWRTLDAIARFVKQHDLWVLADEAYEDYIWDGGKHISFASLPGMFDYTVSVFSFSKCFGASGMRTGYAVAPPAVISQLNRAAVGAYYQPGRLGQLYAWRGMNRFADALNTFRRAYEPTWQWVKENLKERVLPNSATFYFFVDLGPDWLDIPPERKIQKMLDAGVVLAPGEYFGEDYNGWARLCFTAVPPDEIKEGIRRLNGLLS